MFLKITSSSSILLLIIILGHCQGIFRTPTSSCSNDRQCGRTGKCVRRSELFCDIGNILGGGRNCVYYECAQCLYDSHCHWDSRCRSHFCVRENKYSNYNSHGQYGCHYNYITGKMEPTNHGAGAGTVCG